MSVQSYIANNKDRFLDELFSLIRIPSVCARRWTEVLMSWGADNSVVRPTTGNPIVYAEKMVSPAAPTVLGYAHYDEMPAEPLDLWKSNPFEPEIREGRIRARGSDDD